MKAQYFIEAMQRLGVDFYCGVPDSLLKPLSDALYTTYGLTDNHVVTANEGAAVGLAAGHTIATGHPSLVYMQNSGIGNAVNPIASLMDKHVYGIPCVYVVGWRGEPGVKDEPQHLFQGMITKETLALLGLTVFEIGKETTEAELDEMVATCHPILAEGGGVSFVVHKGGLENPDSVKYGNDRTMLREEALEKILTLSGDRDIFVSTTGKTSREVFELREKLGQDHEHDFLTVGSMGHANMIALGIAKEKPDFLVWCLDGDGAATMHLGSLAVECQQRRCNMIHVLLNNGAHESVGGMPVAGGEMRFAVLAKDMGYTNVYTVSTPEELEACLPILREKAKMELCFLEILLRQGSRADLGRPTQTPTENRNGLMKTLSER